MLGLGIQSAANDSWLVAHVADASGTFHFVDLLGQRTIEPIDAAAGLPSPSGRGAGDEGERGGQVSPHPLPGGAGDRARPTLLGATGDPPAGGGGSTFTLRWSDGAVSLVKVVVKTQLADRLLDFPQFTLETLAVVPPDKLGLPEQAILRATGDDSSSCAALYDGKRIVVTRQSEDLTGEKRKRGLSSTRTFPGR